MSDTLRSRTVRAVLWSSFERFGQQGIRFLVTIVLARLLTPADFGLIGILMVFIIVAESVVNSGFAQALIQKKEVSEDDMTTGFVMSVLTAAVLYSVVFASSGAIARFYSQPELVSLTRVVALVIVFDAFVVIQRAQFERKLDFQALTKASVIASILSGVAGISLAVLGVGVWSLAVQMISQKVFLAILLWHHSVWIPRGRATMESFRSLFSYGWKLQVSGILDSFFRNIYALIIGRFFAVDIVGYYTQAKKMKDLPMTNLAGVVGKVTFPAFSTIQDDLPRLKRGYRQSITLLALVAFPLVVGMFVTADRLIPVLLGDQWDQSIPFFRLLCISGLLYVLQASNMNILKVTGRTDVFLKLEIVKKVMTITAVLISIRWGVYALVVGQVITSYFAYILNAVGAGRLIHYSLKEQIQDVLPYLALSLLMGVAVWAIGLIPMSVPWLILVIQFVVGAGVFSALNHLFSTSGWASFTALRHHRFSTNTTP